MLLYYPLITTRISWIVTITSRFLQQFSVTSHLIMIEIQNLSMTYLHRKETVSLFLSCYALPSNGAICSGILDTNPFKL